MAQDIADPELAEHAELEEGLLEFLEADLLPEAAHPLFKLQLREYLRKTLIAEGRLQPRPSRPTGPNRLAVVTRSTGPAGPMNPDAD